jgi:tRNA U34 5-methylaminomethyl-2-thiouridine-forming methyltransferase MnmC
MHDLKIITTADGSHTLLCCATGETYHSRFGAMAESLHIFIRNGLLVLPPGQDTIRILEVGFGTGLNALLSLQYAMAGKAAVEYTAIEPFPLDESLYTQLNYPELPEIQLAGKYFLALHQAAGQGWMRIHEYFAMDFHRTDIAQAKLEPDYYDLVYFDAFAPAIQPEIWEESIFRKISCAVKSGGVLVTYSCKGDVRRALVASGFSVEKVPGPQGKREFLRAKKLTPSH